MHNIISWFLFMGELDRHVRHYGRPLCPTDTCCHRNNNVGIILNIKLAISRPLQKTRFFNAILLLFLSSSREILAETRSVVVRSCTISCHITSYLQWAEIRLCKWTEWQSKVVDNYCDKTDAACSVDCVFNLSFETLILTVTLTCDLRT